MVCLETALLRTVGVGQAVGVSVATCASGHATGGEISVRLILVGVELP